ncbi:MAG: response regulator [Magnetospirillum sp.]|nr:response regulator [Magnetospirillum sp.]
MINGNDLRVLIVDANAHIRRLIATLLGALSVNDVVEARNPSAAMPLIHSKTPDLIITDFTGDAIETMLFVHRIRQGDVKDARIPILALAGSTHHAVLERAWEAGIDDVIAKPISALDVIQRSASLMAQRRRAAAE